MDKKEYKLREELISQQQINTRAREIGEQISKDFAGESVFVIGILKGAVMWMCDVIKHISIPVEIDFMAVSSYGAATKTSGEVRVVKDVNTPMDGRNVIIVEDIVDSGITLNYLKKLLQTRNPKSLRICTLLDKPAGRKKEIHVDYVGFPVDDVFIVGYGLDVDQQYRNLPYITSVEEV